MINIGIKKKIPTRTCSKKYEDYKRYKKYLSADFSNRCGYCDDHDFWSGGYKSYHVEHFIPKERFKKTHEHLKKDYNNLIYCCPYCNIAKGEDWPSNDPTIKTIGNSGYIDPCDKTYMKQFIRNREGKIIPITALGQYMYKHLKLYLKRHEIIWKLDKIENDLQNIKYEIEKISSNEIKKQKLKDLYEELTLEFFNYLRYLRSEVSKC